MEYIGNVKTGMEVEIIDIENSSEPLIKRLEAMGLKKGKKVKLLMKSGRNIVIKINSLRLVIDTKIAKCIKVK